MRLITLVVLVSLTWVSAGLGAGPPGPFRFCYGLDDPSALPILKSLGLDTLYLHLQPGEAMDLQAVRAAVREAHLQGIKVIVELPTCLTGAYRVSPYDERYTGTVRELIQAFVSQLRDEPGLTAWATGSTLERYLTFSDADFRGYLQAGEASLDALNARWGSHLPTWPSVTLTQARTLEDQAPYKIGRAMVDVADYEADAYHRVMDQWLRAIRQVDAARPVLTGRVTLYRSLVSIPNGYDVVCVNMPPEILENDLMAHNPQALDIARRGGKFQVLPVFRVPDNSSPAYADGSLRNWMHHAALHGAVGFGLEDWPMLAPLYEIEQRSVERGRRLTNAIRDAATIPCMLQLRANVAIITSPYASGFDVTRQPVYGYIVDYLPGEPSNLAYDLRLGTRYGVVDYLSVADLQERELASYSCVLAPACLSLPPPQAGQLEEYVRQGGCLVADLGLGAYQTGSWTQVPEVLQQAFGILGLANARERVGDLTAAEGLRALAPWPRGVKAQGLFSPRQGDTAPATQRRSYPVSGWVAEALLTGNASPLATVSARFDEDKRAWFSGVIGRQHGAGIAVFATHPLWQYWPLADGLSQLLHTRLFGRRAGYELVQNGLLQSGPFFGGGDQGAAVYNPGRLPVLAELWAYGARSHAFAGCASQFTAAPGTEGLAPGTAHLLAQAPPAQTQQLAHTPLVVQPFAGEATVLMQEYAPQQVVFEIAGTGCVVRPMARGLDLRGGEPVSVRLILAHGRYPVAAGSRHVVEVKTRGRTRRVTATAGPQGELDLSDTYAGSTITVRPE